MGARRLALALVAAGFAVTPPAAADLPRPDETYEDSDSAGRVVDLLWYDAPVGPLAVMTFAQAPPPGKVDLGLEVFGGVTDRMLTRLSADHPQLADFKFAPSSLNPALVAELDRRLAAGAGGWDAGRGGPLHGAAADVLISELRKVVAGSPVEAAFAAHGYRLVLKGIARIEMSRSSRSGQPKVPEFISEIDMIAVKEAAHGASAGGASLRVCDGTAMLPTS